MRTLVFVVISACAGSGAGPGRADPFTTDSGSDTDSDPIAVASRTPNLLIFVADDLGIDKLDGYGFHPETPTTPVLDGLMAHGVRFDRFWAQPVCSPGRASLMTGLPPHATGVGNALPTGNGNPLDLGLQTLPEMLDGYDSSLVGKWHLSSENLPGNGFRSHPNDSGFGWYAGIIHGMETSATSDGLPQGYYDWERTENGVPARDDRYITTANADDAVARIQAMAEPWLLVVAFGAPHAPYESPPAELSSGVEVGQTAAERRYNASIEALDAEMGRVLEALSPEVAERTTVFFTADNGTPPDVISLPSVESKGSLFEGGLRVPLIVSGYGVSRPGETCNSLVQISDFAATLVDLSGAEPVQGLDSISFAPCLSEEVPVGRRVLAMAEGFSPEGFGPYATAGAAVRDEQYKLIVSSQSPDAFFDLGDLPTEPGNLLPGGLTASQQDVYDDLRAAIPETLAP